MHPEIDRFAHLDSPLHRWDARWKIASFTLLIFAFGFVGDEARLRPEWGRDLPPALVALAASLLLVRLARIPIGFALRRLRPALVFVAILVAILPFTQPADAGSGDLLLGPLRWSPRGFLIALLIALRGFAIILLVFPMFGTTRFDATLQALRALRVPALLVQLTLFSYRYIFVYGDEARRMHQAWRARGFERRFDLHTLRTVGNGAGMLLVGSLERSRRILQAMVSRGYSGTFRTLDQPATRPADVVKCTLTAAAAAAFFLWRL